MNFFVCFSLLFAIWSDYLSNLGWLPGPAGLIPEVLSAIAAALVVLLGTQQRFTGLNPVYWLLFGFIFLNIMFGIVANLVEPGPILAGVRYYFKAIPFFLLPAVYAFSDYQIRWQLALVLVSSFVQLPIALFQRHQTAELGVLTGDYTVGTLSISSHMSMFQISVIALLVAYKASGKLPLKYFLPMLFLVALPTMINETKSTLLFLPLAIIVPMLLSIRGKQRIRKAVEALSLAAVLLAVFIPVYDYYVEARWGYGIVDFLAMEGRVEGYLYKDAEITSEEIGRIDSFTLPLQVFGKDPVRLAFGLGVGNVRLSALGEKFSGEYSSRYEHTITTGLSLLLWETGLLGVVLVVWLQFRLVRDAYSVSKSNSRLREMAVGWVYVVSIFLVGLLYKEFMANDGITFPYWFFSGLVVAEARRLQLLRQNETVHTKYNADPEPIRDIRWHPRPDSGATTRQHHDKLSPAARGDCLRLQVFVRKARTRGASLSILWRKCHPEEWLRSQNSVSKL